MKIWLERCWAHKTRRVIILFALIGILIGLMPVSDVARSVSHTSSIYILEGKNIAEGSLPTSFRGGVGRGPVFPLFLATVYKIFGFYPERLFYGLKAIYFLLLISVFVLCRKKWSEQIAWGIVLCSLLSAQFYKYSLFIDSVSLFNLIFVLWLYVIVGKTPRPFLSGTIFGLLYLTRETTIVLIPVLFIQSFYEKYSFKKYISLFIGLFLIVAPWVLYCKWMFGSYASALGHYNPQLIKDFSETGVGFSIVDNLFSQIGKYAFGTFRVLMTFDYITIFTWAAFFAVLMTPKLRLSTFSFAKKDKLLQVLVLSWLCYFSVPLSSFSFGSIGDVPRHGLPNILMGIMFTGYCIFPALIMLFKKIKPVYRTAALLVITVLVGIYAQNKGYSKYINRVLERTVMLGRYTAEHKTFAQTVDKYCLEGVDLLVDGYFMEPLKYWSNHKCIINEIPPPQLWDGQRQLPSQTLAMVSTSQFQLKPEYRQNFFIWDKKYFLKLPRKTSIIVVSDRLKILWNILEKNSKILEKTSNGLIVELHLSDNINSSDTINIDCETLENINWIKTKNIKMFNNIMIELRRSGLKLPSNVDLNCD